jgi:hypothetical protein
MKIKLTKGFWKIGSREMWTVGNYHFFVSFPEYIWMNIKHRCILILRALNFYTTKCACYNKGQLKAYERMYKYLFDLNDCWKDLKAIQMEVKRENING